MNERERHIITERRLQEEREKRAKLEKHISGLVRWQEEAKYAVEDLRRKIEDVEESRSADKRDLRKEVSKREEQFAVAQADIGKDIDYLRSCIVGKGVGRDGGMAGDTSLRSLESSITALHERCDTLEQTLSTSRTEAQTTLDTVEKKLDAKVDMHESRLLTLTESLNVTKDQVHEATLVADKLRCLLPQIDA